MQMNKPATHAELEVMMQQKKGTHYKVKESHETVTKDVDMAKRTVQVVTNTFYWFDSDCDVLLPGSTKKTIADNGPASEAGAKIKNVYAHNLSLQIGKPMLMDERALDGKHVQYAESKMLKTTKGNDTLIEYQEEVIDQHSIGFQYIGIDMVTADDKDWTKYLNLLINPKDAEKWGFMFLVDEIRQFEWSPVAFGANSLTPYLGVKSGNTEGIVLKMLERVDWLGQQLKHGKQSDETMIDYSLEILQLKQLISEAFSVQPSIKDTLIQQGRRNKSDTELSEFDLSAAIKSTSFFTPKN